MFNCIEQSLSKLFFRIGMHIGRYPGYFIIVPMLLSLFLVTGIQQMQYQDDPEYLFSPTNGRSKQERSVVEHHFPMNFSHNFDAGRMTDKGRFGRIIITAADNKSVLRPHIFDLAVQLDRVVRQMKANWDADDYVYEQLCARVGDHPLPPSFSVDDTADEPEAEHDSAFSSSSDRPSVLVNQTLVNHTDVTGDASAGDLSSGDQSAGDQSAGDASAQTQHARRFPPCYSNDVLDLRAYLDHMHRGLVRPTFPVWSNNRTLKTYYFPSHLGGVSVDRNSTLHSAQALSLMYFLNINAKHAQQRAHVWEQQFLHTVQQWQASHPQVHVARYVSTTLKDELDRNTHTLVPFFSLTVIIMVAFSVATSTSLDWVRCKPWLGLLSCVSAGLSVAASFGLCMYAGIPMIGINLAAPFLMLGVGMDDTFVLMAAWSQTSMSAPVPQRMAQTYSEAAVSITITSITNFISFVIGTITPFPSVRIFCIYSAVSILFTYIFHIMFFGGCMSVFGYIERNNLHTLICVPIMPKSAASGKGCFYKALCTGGINRRDPNNRKDHFEPLLTIFFRDVVGKAHGYVIFKLFVLLAFAAYLLVGMYGCTQLKEGLDRRKLSRDDSYSIDFYDLEDRYFREYPHRIQLVFNQSLEYSEPEVQQQVESVLQSFENSEYIGDATLTESWLRAYLRFLNQEQSVYFLSGYNMSQTEDFYAALRDVFLQFPLASHFRSDIEWDETGTRISASRHVLQTVHIADANAEKNMLIELRRIADSAPVLVTIYHQLFVYFDQFILVREVSLQNITMAALIMMVISLLFIPSVACALFVAFAIVSIEIGVIGFMSLWSVNLDTISMINLIMCIGFSVDFSAHISFAYMNSNLPTPNQRVQAALHSLGMPIFQGAVSTILGILALSFAPSYIFVTFFKTVFLVMVFGALHGILLLPVLLSITDACCGFKKKHPPMMPSSDMFNNYYEQQFTVGVGPPFSKPSAHKTMLHPPLAMGGPAFGAVPMSAPPFLMYQHSNQNKYVPQHVGSDADGFAFYRNQIAFLPVGSEVNPYVISATLSRMQSANQAHVSNPRSKIHKQFKHAKLVTSNDSFDSTVANDAVLETLVENEEENNWKSTDHSPDKPIESQSEIAKSLKVPNVDEQVDCEPQEVCTCSASETDKETKCMLKPKGKAKKSGKVNYGYASGSEEQEEQCNDNSEWDPESIWERMYQLPDQRMDEKSVHKHRKNKTYPKDIPKRKLIHREKVNVKRQIKQELCSSSSQANQQPGTSRQFFY